MAAWVRKRIHTHFYVCVSPTDESLDESGCYSESRWCIGISRLLLFITRFSTVLITEYEMPITAFYYLPSAIHVNKYEEA